MAIAPERMGIGISRHFTKAGEDPYSSVEWERRDARIVHYGTGAVVFEQLGVEVPARWSLNATNILAQKYFRGTLGEPEREWSLRQVVDRVVDTITGWGRKEGYFVDDEEADAFSDELKYLIIHQKAAFNSPVWFNIGVKGVPQQGSACFILAVEDSMDSILNWYTEEGIIFKGGSGAGVNLSRIRSSKEGLRGGGTASGPVSFMRGADASAGTIKSGGKTRRAAKMVILDVDHPDIEDFVWCKAIEERKARALRDAGFDMDLDGKDSYSIQYQNANNSVRVTDEFMQAVLDDGEWALRAVTTGEAVDTVRARDLFHQISKAAWECADPGMQFDTTINRWHTAPNSGRINASNPCSEYMHIDNSACNLASLNLLTFLGADGAFDVAGFKAATEVVFTAQEIIVGNADYPTEKIGENSRRFRQLGIGYANLGALLMAEGLPYDSDGGRAWAAAITALLTGHSYATSARTASRMGPFAGYSQNRDAMLDVLRMHRDAAARIDEELVPPELLSAAQEAWDTAVDTAEQHGVRNAQASVLAPTGTIGLLMDCDTTGIEPDLGLVKMKKLVGGGTMSIVNQTVPRALARLGYTPDQVADVVAYIDEHKSIVGAPHLSAEHLPVFACSMGDNTIHYRGHIKMMGAVQPFISGAISKTVNVPEEVTVEDVAQLHIEAWQLGLKAVAIYRDNCKVAQPLATAKKTVADPNVSAGEAHDAELALKVAELEKALERQTVVVKQPVRERLPRRRKSSTFKFRVADCEGYVTVGEYDDGRPGEVFIKVSKQGSTLAGIMDAFSVAISISLQHGVPLATFVRKYTNMRFEPAGMTDDPDLRIAQSLVDYIFRRLAVDYLPYEERVELGVLTSEERTQAPLP
ncbi:MAG TPA: vitamin B12-dependent ribonucleotide reductase, partial [Acidimicrobiales bacterium]|nr:vitamin B12-dependent ribonucleotide reductase [Acidimicrobiales bacterium]